MEGVCRAYVLKEIVFIGGFNTIFVPINDRQWIYKPVYRS